MQNHSPCIPFHTHFYTIIPLGDAGGSDIPRIQAIKTIGRDVHHLVVYDRYGEAVAVKCCFAYLLPTIEARH
jgi:hypothetical protein